MTDHHAPDTSRVVVMTGGTSGIGAIAVERLARQPGTLVLVGARGSGRAVPDGVEVIPLDLASLHSVREFADTVLQRLGGRLIDALVLNAGMQRTDAKQVSADGYELTFAVNHLAHYLLARLLHPQVADGGRIVITTSETHDPAVSPFGPKAFEPHAWAQPGESGFGSGQRAYGASNLGRMLTARSLAAADDVTGRGITVVAFSPGLTGGTSLGRDASPIARFLVRFMMNTVFRVVGLFRPEFVIGKPERAGEVLAEVASGALTPPAGRIYMNLVKGTPNFPDPSEMARDDDVRDSMWKESATMVGPTGS